MTAAIVWDRACGGRKIGEVSVTINVDTTEFINALLRMQVSALKRQNASLVRQRETALRDLRNTQRERDAKAAALRTAQARRADAQRTIANLEQAVQQQSDRADAAWKRVDNPRPRRWWRR